MRQPGWIDRNEREPSSFPGVVILPGGARREVIISNVSAMGCRVECHEMLIIGAKVKLEVGDTLIDAEVRWALPGSAGLRMLED